MTGQSKRKDDEEAWRSFVEIYVKRIKLDVEGASENYDVERKRIMKENNPR